MQKGCYILFLRFKREVLTRVGSLGIHRIPRGLYAYVGSAKGPGGIEARVKRHIRKDKRVKWHIDYLTTKPECFIEAVMVVKSSTLKEKELVRFLETKGGVHLIRGFGSSDDKFTLSHLLYFGKTCLNNISHELKRRYKERITTLYLDS